MADAPFNADRPARLPPVREDAIPAVHRERLMRHYAALRTAFPWNEYKCAYRTANGGEVWRHPQGLSEKESHELRHEERLADLSFRIVSLPENFPSQSPGISPPDAEVDGLITQLRYRRLGASDEPTVEVSRNIRSGRRSAPVVLYVLAEAVPLNVARLDGTVRFVFGLDRRLHRVQIYREARGRLHLLYQRGRDS